MDQGLPLEGFFVWLCSIGNIWIIVNNESGDFFLELIQ